MHTFNSINRFPIITVILNLGNRIFFAGINTDERNHPCSDAHC